MVVVIWTFVFLIVFISGYTDIRSGRVYNWVTYPAAVVGMVLNGLHSGPGGLLFGLEGCLAGLGILLIPYLIGLVGGGDVKLLAAVGAFLGPANVLWVAAYGCIAGGVVAIALLLKRRQFKSTLMGFLALPVTGITSLVGDKADFGDFPFAVNFALGVVILRLLVSVGAIQ